LQANPTPLAVGPATRSMTISTNAPRATPPVSEAARRLCAQGLIALAAGDITGARLYLERAAEAGDARALMVLGQSYDPAMLVRIGAIGIKGDADKARDYYAKALAAGMGAARERMAALEAP
jgi:TPR repeat protein